MQTLVHSFDLPPERAGEIANKLLQAIPPGWVGDAWDGVGEQALFSKPGRRGHVAHCYIITVPHISSFSSRGGVRQPRVKLKGQGKHLAPLLAQCASLGLISQPAAGAN